MVVSPRRIFARPSSRIRWRHGARIALEVMLCRAVVNHGAHLIIDHDEFVDAGASAIAIAGIAARAVQRGRRFLGGHVQQAPFVFAAVKACRLSGFSTRTRRCARTPIKLEERRKGSIPMSRRRVTAPTARVGMQS